MEADWEFEIGEDAPVIEARWTGFVDLRLRPELAASLSEAAAYPALIQALVRLNAAHSPVFTSKCDFFPSLAPAEFDAGELDAAPTDAAQAMACYIDLLPSGGLGWRHPDLAAGECKRICVSLHSIPLRRCRADLIIRRVFSAHAIATPDRIDLGITAYLTACGPTRDAAASALEASLAAFASSVATAGIPSPSALKLQWESAGE
jgi:hypothetical protein